MRAWLRYWPSLAWWQERYIRYDPTLRWHSLTTHLKKSLGQRLTETKISQATQMNRISTTTRWRPGSTVGCVARYHVRVLQLLLTTGILLAVLFLFLLIKVTFDTLETA